MQMTVQMRRPAALLASILGAAGTGVLAVGGCTGGHSVDPSAGGGAFEPGDTQAIPPTLGRAPATTPAPVSVSIDNFSFGPRDLTIAAGQTVTWVNHDDVPHTVVATGREFASGALDTDESYAHAFTAPGTYAYYCGVHPHMTGRIIVK
jgi:plastocyanin